MFGPSKEVKQLSADTKDKVDAMWKKWDEDKDKVANSDFVAKLLDFNERNHPKTLMGKKKKLDDYFHIGQDIIKDFDFNILAKQMNEPQPTNLGDCFNGIDYENELIISIYYNSDTGFVLTNKKLYFYLKGGKFFDGSANYFSKNLDEIKEITIKKGFSQNSVVLNGDDIGNIYNDDSLDYIRKLIAEVARSSSDLVKSSNIETKVVSEETGLDKLKKLKELLDMDVLTQEEFDKQKDEIMKTL